MRQIWECDYCKLVADSFELIVQHEIECQLRPVANVLYDVAAFHRQFELPVGGPARLLTDDELNFRVKFMTEELTEYIEAHRTGDMSGCLDALIDLIYVALGTVHFHGMTSIFYSAWSRVQQANMAKVRGAADGSNSKRGSKFDVVKPEGWVPPTFDDLLGGAQ